MRQTRMTLAPDGLVSGNNRLRGSGRPLRYDRIRGRIADLALAHLPLALAVIDRECRLVYWNAQAATLWGLPPLMAAERPDLRTAVNALTMLSAVQRERLMIFCSESVAQSDRLDGNTALCLAPNRGRRLCIEVRGIGRGNWMLTLQDSAFGGPAERAGREYGGEDVWLDALTGLPNRRQLAQVLQELPREAQHGVLLLDVIGLEAINDTVGRSAGDALLCLIGRRLSRELRQDDLPAYVGGGTFAVLMLNGEAAERLAERLVAILAQPFMVEGRTISVRFGIGLALWHGSAEAMLHQAELALKAAKASGPNRWSGPAT